MSRRIQVIVNPAAGQPEPILPVLNQVFQEEGVEWDVSITHEPGDGTRLASQAVDRGVDVVAAYGGDGTVMEVMNGLVHSDVPLAILPGGTGDILAVEFQIPGVLEQAARLACAPQPEIRRVDVGRCGDRHFLLRLSIGFNARQIQATSRDLRDRYGKLAYLFAALQALPETEPVQFSFSFDGESVAYEGVTCLVANAGSLGVPGLALAPQISMSDGLLDVMAVRDLDLEALSAVAASIVAAIPDEANLGYWQAQEIHVECDPPQPVVADGEDLGQTPVTVQAVPRAIQVIVVSSQ
jgi:YegS/Rv2252/BmrU family lipid kinase